MKKSPISVIIPVYRNYEMFYRYLGLNKKYLQNCEVIVMNDYPGENITKEVIRILPSARVFNNKQNLGFAGNANLGVKKSKNNYVFLMNSDVVLKDDSFTKSIRHFRKDRKLFAVGFAQFEKNGSVVGSNRGYFENGFINHSHQPLRSTPHALSPNFWAEGGAAVFNKKIFIKLGMLDGLFNPFYWEDIDLSYRAWKAGYRIGFEIGVVVEHHHESTIGKYFDKQQVLATAFGNQLIFLWKNLTDRAMITSHFLNLIRLFAVSVLKLDRVFLIGFFRALNRLPAVLESRKKTIKLNIRSDRDVLALFEK